MPVLTDIREEKFCQLVAQGRAPHDAKLESGLPKGRSITMLLRQDRIQGRVTELLDAAASKAALTRAGLIEEVHQEWKLARAAGQHSASLKAAEMLGQELFGMFRKQLEVGKPGEFDAMDEDSLRKFILKKVSDLGLTVNQLDTKLIEQTQLQPVCPEVNPEQESATDSQ